MPRARFRHLSPRADMGPASPRICCIDGGFIMRYQRRRRALVLVPAALSLLGLLVFLFIDRNISPALIAISEASVYSLAQRSMNNAVQEILGEDLSYADLITTTTDNNGNVEMLSFNTVRMNHLSTLTANLAQEKIAEEGNSGVSVPLGSVLRSELLAGSGPYIRVKVLPIGSVSTEFFSEFENAGINQTRHKIYMVLRAHVQIVVPLNQKNIDVVNKVPIAETIIVGDVPNSYVNVDETGKMLNLVPTPSE
jgi:sporulation protein YunB